MIQIYEIKILKTSFYLCGLKLMVNVFLEIKIKKIYKKCIKKFQIDKEWCM